MGFKIDELFYELDARTAGFEKNITHAQTTVDNFAKFIREKPMLATAALAASIIAVGVASVKMASDVDVSIRKVQAAFPGATGEIDKLRNALALLSTESPRSQKELAEAAASIAEKGVDSVSELIARLRISTTVADATGRSLETVSDGLDLIADAFRLTTHEASNALTVIYGFTAGKVGIDEVFETLKKGAPVLADLGVKAEDAGQALAILIDAGVNQRQAGLALTNILELTNRVRELRRGTEDQARAADVIEATLSKQNIARKGFIASLGELASGLEKAGVDTRELGIRANVLTSITRVAEVAANDHRTATEKLADAQERLSAAADTNRTSAHALSQILLNELSESFIKLGNKILPTVISLLEKTADVMARIRGEGNAIKDINILQGPLPDPNANPNSRLKQTRFETPAEKAARAFANAIEGAGTRAERYGADAFSGLSEAELRKMIDNVQRYSGHAAPGTSPRQLDILYNTLQEALRKAIADAATEKPGAGAAGGGPGLPALEKATKDAIRSMRQGIRESLANASTTQIDDATAMVTKFRTEVDALEKQARQKLPDLRAEVERLSAEPARVEAKERAEAAKNVADEVAKALGLQSVAMNQALQDFNDEVAKRNAEYAKLGKAPLFSDEQVAQVRSVREAIISVTQSAEELDAVLSRIRAEETARPLLTPSSSRGERLEAMGFNVASSIELQGELAKRRAELSAVAGKEDAASKAKAKGLLDQIATLQGKINDLETRNRSISNDINAALMKRIQLLTDQANAIATAAGLVADLAGAFGDTGQAIAGVIRGIGSIGQAAMSVKPFLETLKTYRAGTKDDAGNPLVSLGGVFAAAMPIIGGITAAAGIVGQLFGKSPEQLRAAALQKENTEALRQLTKRVGDLGRINVTGTQLGLVNALLGRPELAQAAKFPAGFADTVNRIIGSALDAVGLSATEFKEIMRSFGLQIDDAAKITVADVNALRDAIKKSELTQFADTFAGQMSQFDAAIKIFDLTKPIDQFNALRRSIAAIANGGGKLQQLLDSFDLTTPEGVTAAITALQDLFTQMQAGTITAADLGGLTPEQFEQLIERTIALLREQAGAGGGALGTGGFNVDRTITEVTGSRLQALLVTGNTFLEQIAYATTAIAAAMGIAGLPAITPPDVTGKLGGGGDTYYNISVVVEGSITSGDADEIGGRIGRGIVTQIDKGLGREAKWRAITAGKSLKA